MKSFRPTILFGAGSCCSRLIDEFIVNVQNPIIIDNDVSKVGKLIDEFEIQSPKILRESDFNQIIITSSFIHEIQQQLVREYHIDPQKISFYNYKKKAVEKLVPESFSNRFGSNHNFLNLIEHLPKITRINIECGEIDLYGVRHSIAKKAGLNNIPKTNTAWIHGWHALPLVDPRHLVSCGNYNEIKRYTYLTNTKKESNILSNCGFKQATAVGANFLYAKPQDLPKRVPNSILVIPAHTTESCPDSVDIYQSALHLINKIDQPSNLIACCIGGSDAVSLNKDLYSKITFPLVTGAWVFDKNALSRMWMIFSAFETIITDVIGSHIPYALACGAKVEIIKPKKPLNKNAILDKEPFYKANPDLLDFVLKEKTKSGLRKNFPEIFNASSEVDRITTGYKLLGHDNIREMKEIMSLLGWK